jgi:hypothetical protein
VRRQRDAGEGEAVTPTATQRAAYHEAARAHSIPALAVWLATTAVAALGFAVRVLGGES